MRYFVTTQPSQLIIYQCLTKFMFFAIKTGAKAKCPLFSMIYAFLSIVNNEILCFDTFGLKLIESITYVEFYMAV